MRKGFTLIELLVVVTIIAALAMIAMPRYQESRAKAFFASMKADLRQLSDLQEMYYSGHNYLYGGSPGQSAQTVPELDFHASEGVVVTVRAAANSGWSADATHAGLNAATQRCAVFAGGAPALPPAGTTGVIACMGE